MNKRHQLMGLLDFSSIRTGMEELQEATEFYFSARTEDRANDIALDLHDMGYVVHRVIPPEETGMHWLVTGWTTYLPFGEEQFEKWLDKMHYVAEANQGRLESFGFLLECPEHIPVKRVLEEILDKRDRGESKADNMEV